MSLHRVYGLKCAQCPAQILDSRLKGGKPDVDNFRRWTRRHGWRRPNRVDLCPSCVAAERIERHVAKLPRGLF